MLESSKARFGGPFFITGLSAVSIVAARPAYSAASPQPDTKAKPTTTYRHIPKTCSPKAVKLILWKTDKAGNIVPVAVVMIAKGC